MFESVFVLIVIVVLIAALAKDVVPPSIGFLGAVAAVLLANVISVDEALGGFSNPVLIIIASLFVIARALQRAVNTGKLLERGLGRRANLRLNLTRLLVPTAATSSVINNTPIVASLIQPLERWADKRRISVSLLLMPLSFAAILGGVVTLTGTSTNLVVSGLLDQAGYGPMGFFEITHLGLPVALAGLVTIIFVLPKLLPKRKTPRGRDVIKQSVIEFTAQRSLAGQTVAAAKLRNMKRLYLATLIRKTGEILAPVTPSTVIRTGDTLQFVGDIAHVVDPRQLAGLKPKADKHRRKLGLKQATFYEVVLGHESAVINKTLKEVNFRGYYQAAVFAIHRSGALVKRKLGEVKLRAGDTLLIVADDYFKERWEDERDFLLISRLDHNRSISSQQFKKLVAIGVFVLGLKVLLDASLVALLLTTAILTVLSGLLSINEARRSIDFDLLILIGASISFASAVLNSGLAGSVAHGLTGLFGGLGVYGLLLGVIVAALILTELVTNTASASLLFPIVTASAVSMGFDPRLFALVLAVACSLSFLSPLGYQTNTMVFGPGGYKFTDFAKAGSVLTVVCSVTLFLTAALLLR